MTLTKDHIVNSIQEQLGLSESKSFTLFESLLEIMKKRLKMEKIS